MKILGIDTSTTVASVALMDETKLINEITINDKKTHSQKLMVMIENLFSLADFELEDVDLIAVGVGPGSFTGLRIGVSTAKALAHGTGIEVVEISSLEALANGVPDTTVCAMMDARRETVFAGVYGALQVKEEQVHIDELLEKLKDETVTFIGDGASLHKEKISKLKNASFVENHLNIIKAGSICTLAMMSTQAKKYDDVHVTYLKKSQAEREYEAKKHD